MALNHWNDRAEILSIVQSWGFWRDNERWKELGGAYAPDAWMFTSWSALPASDFVAACKSNMHQRKYAVRHDAGASHIDIVADRAIVETNNVLRLRGVLHDVEVDVTSYGRTYDRFVKLDTGWKIQQRNGVYEKGRIDPVDPSRSVALDPILLEKYPEGYRHLAYFQVQNGGRVSTELPVPGSVAMEKLRAEGVEWLNARAAT